MASPIIRARMKAIIEGCDKVLAHITDEGKIRAVAEIRAEALARLQD